MLKKFKLAKTIILVQYDFLVEIFYYLIILQYHYVEKDLYNNYVCYLSRDLID